MKEQEGRNGQVLEKFCKKFVPTFLLLLLLSPRKKVSWTSDGMEYDKKV